MGDLKVVFSCSMDQKWQKHWGGGMEVSVVILPIAHSKLW